MTHVIAHAADWIESAVFLVPILGFGLWLAITAFKDRRGRRRGEGDDADAGSGA